MIDLAGTWSLCDQQGTYSLSMQLPGDGVSALEHAGIVPDPYWGRNEYDVRKMSQHEWVVKRTFCVDGTDFLLAIQGIDTVAEVSVNGQQVAATENCFRSYEIDVSKILKIGENEIDIRFFSNPKMAQKLQEEQPFYVPWQDGNGAIGNVNMLRKVQCDFGWDWGVALSPFGVYGDIKLVPKRDVALGDVRINQSHENHCATVDIAVDVIGAGDDCKISIDFAGDEQRVSVKNGAATAQFKISDPDLWWPAGLGKQTLHDLRIKLDDQIATRRIGLRTLELITEKDDVGLGFKFRVNGHDLFMRGANWIPADALPSRITEDKTRALLQSAVDANMNMLRVWGGGRYEPDYFYDYCDEMGLLVWQDFMFACNLYPSTPDFLAEVDAEAREQVARIGHHASLAVWCGDNELIGALGWFEESIKDRDRYLVSYDRLNRTLETALKETLPDANWWPSSPSPGPMNFGDAWHDDGSGDMHFWSVWHEGKDFAHYRDVRPRFCSEFGFQSFPSMNTIRTFADDADMNIASPVMESHQKNAGGNARIAETMFRYFRFPVGFENFVYVSQVQQGLAIKTAVEFWRSVKPRCMGTLFWQLNDTWPVASWSSLDYGGNWKLLHHMARDFYAMELVVAVPNETGIALTAIQDHLDPCKIQVSAFASNMVGELRKLGEGLAEVTSTENAILLHLPNDALKPGEILYFEWQGSDGQTKSDHFAPVPYKALDLVDAQLEFEVAQNGNDWTITLNAQALALFVSFEADVPGRFSDNAFTMVPNKDVTIVFSPDEPSHSGTIPNFTLRNLFTATYGTA
ncbi:MAG: glycoside hydrolase family 2 protein [Hyphomicrobiales bacterium]